VRSKFAIWSWILATIGLILYPGVALLAGIINVNCAYRGNLCFTLVELPPLLFMFVVTITGLIFGIMSLKKISLNPNLTGKPHAIIGTILNIILILYGLFTFVGGIFGS